MRPIGFADLLFDLDTGAAVRLVGDDRQRVTVRRFEAEWLEVTQVLALGGAMIDGEVITPRRLQLDARDGGLWPSIMVVWDGLTSTAGPTLASLWRHLGDGALPLELACGLATSAGVAERRWGHGLANVGGVCVGGPAGVVVFPHYEMGAAGARHPVQPHLLGGSTDPDEVRAFSLAMFTFRVLTGRWPFAVPQRFTLEMFGPSATAPDDTSTPLRRWRSDAPADLADVVDDIISLPAGRRPSFEHLLERLDARGRIDVDLLDAMARSTGWPGSAFDDAVDQLLLMDPRSVRTVSARAVVGPADDTLAACLQRVTRMDLT